MIKQLRSASDQLRAAWDNYRRIYSNLESYRTLANKPGVPGFSPDICHQLDAEIAFLSSYTSEAKEMRAAISCARNESPGLAPINTLPPEILIRIFHLVLLQPCGLQDLIDQAEVYRRARNPDCLAQVCSFWRKAAISCCSLWRHVDLCAFSFHKGLVDRGRAHVARAGELPIELHVNDHRYDLKKSPLRGYLGLGHIIAYLSCRVEALTLNARENFRHFHGAVVKQVLLVGRSTLRKLVIVSERSYRGCFISAGDINRSWEDRLFGYVKETTEDEIEKGFALITVLHLRGIFPVWSSAAYHGLVDLRLYSTKSWPRIREAEFVAILQSSPELRVLHFELEIYDLTGAAAEVTPVCLGGLEVVKLFFRKDWNQYMLCPSSVLRLLVPGSKPLRLSFHGDYQPNPSVFMELERFLARSKVVKFYTQGVLPPMGTFRHAANLERLILDDFLSASEGESLPEWLQGNGLGLSPSPRSIYITGSILSQDDLGLLVGWCPTGTWIHNSSVRRAGEEVVKLSRSEVSMKFPTVRVTDYKDSQFWVARSGDPAADWDVLD